MAMPGWHKDSRRRLRPSSRPGEADRVPAIVFSPCSPSNAVVLVKQRDQARACSAVAERREHLNSQDLAWSGQVSQAGGKSGDDRGAAPDQEVLRLLGLIGRQRIQRADQLPQLRVHPFSFGQRHSSRRSFKLQCLLRPEAVSLVEDSEGRPLTVQVGDPYATLDVLVARSRFPVLALLPVRDQDAEESMTAEWAALAISAITALAAVAVASEVWYMS